MYFCNPNAVFIGQCWDILKKGVSHTLVFELFEPEKFNKHKQKQCGG